MTTARDLIKSALKKINELGIGQDLTAEDANDGLTELNSMIASWSTQNALIYTETKETFSLTGAESYTIGSGQDFDTTAPREILSAYVTYGGIDYPVQIVSEREYAYISDKDLTGIPEKLYFDSNYPIANAYIWPVNNGSMTLTLISLKPLTTLSSLNTDFTMPPEYEAAIIYNLAVRRAPDYEKEASLTVKAIAKSSLAWIKAQNQKNNKGPVKIDISYLSRGRYDIKSNTYR